MIIKLTKWLTSPGMEIALTELD